MICGGVVASDKARDVAIVKATGKNFRKLTLGNSDRVEVGQEVVAIGNPRSLESTVSNGIVSGIRTAEELGGKFLQVTAPISPGSSGGPLFNMAGEVIGITTLYPSVHFRLTILKIAYRPAKLAQPPRNEQGQTPEEEWRARMDRADASRR